MNRMMERPRFSVWPGRNSCEECLDEQMAQIDEFVFRTDGILEAVSVPRDNPFYQGLVEVVSECVFDDGVSVDRQSLMTRSAESVCAHISRHLPENPDTGYRSHELGEFFSELPVDAFVSPVHGAIGTMIYYSLDGLVTAKASGFLIEYAGQNSYTRPWGGHCLTYRDAARLGVLEGAERLGAESGACNQVLPEPPEGISRREPRDFGVADSDWKIPAPEVAAWVVGSELDLTSDGFMGKHVALPERLVFYRPLVDRVPWVQESSNGCAVGGSDCEAMLFGLLEAVERDAFLIAWYGGLRLSPISSDSVTDAESRAYLERMALCGARVQFLDATCGLPIPTVIAVCEEPGGSICVGAGSSLDPERALRSALVEVASDFQVVAGQRVSNARRNREMLRDYSRVAVMEDHASMFADPGAHLLISHWVHPELPEVPLAGLSAHLPEVDSDVPWSAAGMAATWTELERDLAKAIAICQSEDFFPVAVPMQHGLSAALGISCWKTVVPGLIPIDFGFAHQRALLMPRLETAVRRFRQMRADESFSPQRVPHPFP